MSVSSTSSALVSEADLKLFDYLESHPSVDSKSVTKKCGGNLSRKNACKETLLHEALRFQRAIAAVWLMNHRPKLLRATSEISPPGCIDGSIRSYVAHYCPQVTFALPAELLFVGTRFEKYTLCQIYEAFPRWPQKHRKSYVLEFGVKNLVVKKEHLVIKMIREAQFDVAQFLIEYGAPVEGALAAYEELEEKDKDSKFRDSYLSNPLSKTLIYKYLKKNDENKFTKHMRRYSGGFNQRVGDEKPEFFFILVLATGNEAMLHAFLERAQLLNKIILIDPTSEERKRALELADNFSEPLCKRVKKLIRKNKQMNAVVPLDIDGIKKSAEDRKFKEKLKKFWFGFTNDKLTAKLEKWFREADGKYVLGVREKDSKTIQRVPGLLDTQNKPKAEGKDILQFIWQKEVYKAWLALMDIALKTPSELDEILTTYLLTLRTKEGLPIAHLLLANLDFAGLVTLKSIMPEALDATDASRNEAITFCETLEVVSIDSDSNSSNVLGSRDSLCGGAKTPREVLNTPVVSQSSTPRLNVTESQSSSLGSGNSATQRNSPRVAGQDYILLHSGSQSSSPGSGNSATQHNSPRVEGQDYRLPHSGSQSSSTGSGNSATPTQRNSSRVAGQDYILPHSGSQSSSTGSGNSATPTQRNSSRVAGQDYILPHSGSQSSSSGLGNSGTQRNSSRVEGLDSILPY